MAYLLPDPWSLQPSDSIWKLRNLRHVMQTEKLSYYALSDSNQTPDCTGYCLFFLTPLISNKWWRLAFVRMTLFLFFWSALLFFSMYHTKNYFALIKNVHCSSVYLNTPQYFEISILTLCCTAIWKFGSKLNYSFICFVKSNLLRCNLHTKGFFRVHGLIHFDKCICYVTTPQSRFGTFSSLWKVSFCLLAINFLS